MSGGQIGGATMENPEPAKNHPASPWFVAQIGMVKHTINLMQIAQVTSAATGGVTVHLSNGEHIPLNVKDAIRLMKLIGS
jgi:hypothetical protein